MNTDQKKHWLNLEVIDLLFILISFIIFTVLLLSTDIRYLDYGDGVHLYIARRITEGVFLYRDVIAPHPPVLFITGSLLLRIHDSLMIIRLFNILIGIVTGVAIFLISNRFFTTHFIPA